MSAVGTPARPCSYAKLAILPSRLALSVSNRSGMRAGMRAGAALSNHRAVFFFDVFLRLSCRTHTHVIENPYMRLPPTSLILMEKKSAHLPQKPHRPTTKSNKGTNNIVGWAGILPSVVKSRAFCQKEKRVCRRGGSRKLAAASQNPDTSRMKVRRKAPRQEAREQELRNGRKTVEKQSKSSLGQKLNTSRTIRMLFHHGP